MSLNVCNCHVVYVNLCADQLDSATKQRAAKEAECSDQRQHVFVKLLEQSKLLSVSIFYSECLLIARLMTEMIKEDLRIYLTSQITLPYEALTHERNSVWQGLVSCFTEVVTYKSCGSACWDTNGSISNVKS